MTAGSIAVPTIIPLRLPQHGRSKTSIDSNTKIELHSDSKDVDIHYTINGTKPDPFPKTGVVRCTMQYVGPFTLPPGKQTVRCVAVSKDGMRESNVCTKVFEVEYVPGPAMMPEDDDLEFQEEIEKEQQRLNVKRAAKNLMLSSKSAWTDVAAMKNTTQKMSDMHVTGSSRHKPQSEPRFLNSRRGEGSSAPGKSYELSRNERYWDRHQQETVTPNPRHQQQADYMRNVYGYADRLSEQNPAYYNSSYNNNMMASQQALSPYGTGRKMDICSYCKSMVPFNTTHCVVCEGPLPGAHLVDTKHVPVPNNFLPVSFPVEAPPKRPTTSTSTQTVGLFYPSEKGISKKKEQEEEKIAFEKQMRDRRPLLTSVSPGKGYWRKQVDHISQHLKAHAQNDAEFRALIGEPKMGKLLSSTVQEDGYELSVTLTFAIRGNKDPLTGRKIGMTGDYLSMHTERSNMSTYRSDDEVSDDTTIPVKTKTTKKRPKKKPGPKIAAMDQKLLRELGTSGEGDPTEVQQLIDEGAEATCTNKDGLPCIYVAVKNKRIDCIPILVENGVDINQKGPSSMKGNTPLHEAVNLGPSGLKTIDALLGCNADMSRKNDRGETAHDLALKGGYDSIVDKFNAFMAQSTLRKMTKPKQISY